MAFAIRRRKSDGDQEEDGIESILRSSDKLWLMQIPPGFSSRLEELNAANCSFDKSNACASFVLESRMLPLREENKIVCGRVDLLPAPPVIMIKSGALRSGWAPRVDSDGQSFKYQGPVTRMRARASSATLYFSRASTSRVSDAAAAAAAHDDEGDEEEEAHQKKGKKTKRSSGTKLAAKDSDDDGVGPSVEKKKSHKKRKKMKS